MNNRALTFTIVIPALNEEKNIKGRLGDILSQINPTTMQIESVFVISDASIDDTDQIVANISKVHSVVKLIRNDERLGKIGSLELIFKKIYSDYVILFDADVRLAKGAISEVMNTVTETKAELTAGNPVPNIPSSLFNVAEQASMFSWYLVQEIKTRMPQSIYSAHGRILVLAKNLYQNVELSQLSSPGDDQFFYICANFFAYSKNAKVYYKLPGRLHNYLKQNVRFRYAKTLKRKFSAQKNKNDYFRVNNKLSILTKTIVYHPYSFILWSILYIVGYIVFLKKKITGDASIKEWGVALSTK